MTLRLSACPPAVAIILALAVLPDVAEAAPLPRLAVSVPASVSLSMVLGEFRAAGVGVSAVVPVGIIRVGTNASRPDSTSLVASWPSVPDGVETILSVDLELGPVAGEGAGRDREIERQIAEQVAQLDLGRSPAGTLLVQMADVGPAPELAQFVVATLAVQARAVRPLLRIFLMPPTDVFVRQADAASRLAAYADTLVFPLSALAADRDRRLAESAGGRPVMARVDAGAGPSGAAAAYLDAIVTDAAQAETLWLDVPTVEAARWLGRSLRFLGQAIGGGFETAAIERAPVAVEVDGQPAVGIAFISGQTPDLRLLIDTAASQEAPRAVRVRGADGEAHVECFNPLDGRALASSGDGVTPACVSDVRHVLLAFHRGGGEQRVVESVSVRGRADLRVEEIIARWQASRGLERRQLENYSVPCLLTLHFESASFGAKFDVSQELQHFVDRSGTNDWVQTSLLVNGVRLKKGQEFPLPMLEPEKVLTQPLELSMDEKYTYRLLGTDTVNDALSYVIAIQPTVPDERLYAGKVWIDGVTFRQVRLQLEQRSGQHNIASHVETQDFRTVHDAEGRDFSVLGRIFVQEALNVGGRPVTLEKRYRFEEYAINTADFEARLAAARSSDGAMYRDTEQGLRALRKQGDTLVVEPSAGKKIRSIVAGTLYDASFAVPVPLAGISWVDFDYRGTGAQLSAVFAGLFLAANVSSQRGPNVRTSLETYLSALPMTDQVYAGNAELAGQRIRSFEQWVGAVVNWQVTPTFTLSASSHLTYTMYARTGATDDAFAIPGNAVSVRAWAEGKYVRRSFDVNALVEPSFRLTGRGDYGYVGSPQSPSGTSVKYQAEVNKRVYAGRLTRGGVSTSYFGGWNLDRLTRYHNSFLGKPQILGVPTGVDAFDAVAIARAYYGFNVMDLVKLEGSYNHAWARNLGESGRFRQFDGVSVDLGTAGPWGTYVQGSLSLALRGNLQRYDSRWGLMALFFKPMRRP